MKLSIKDITQTFIALHLKYKVSSTASRINNLVFLSFWKLSINNGKTRKIFKDDVFAVESGFYYPTIIEYFVIEPKYSYCISKQDFKMLVSSTKTLKELQEEAEALKLSENQAD